ncbi:helix-hairpin-helix domain-containing protein [Tumebacillus sp. DT12]|uniref:Helix-hairpin-helix domain-containing protein n=1 Tax=Tumebacillus lacus TaxID=2995335 RepID=A0ABT3X4E1_9BACL|nr:helix-hairpin-helix domain-containing protein [Tumebacillus lacus]MCX7570471.1 helix-hairpin-helix domain-containing protein [Tumebacillus lacus]
MQKKERFLMLTLLVGILLAGSVYLYGGKPNQEAMVPVTADRADGTGQKDAAEAAVMIKVHVKGEVNRPGVYQIPADSRVIDAVEAAGGAKDSADVNELNLAAVLSDSIEIVVPQTGVAAKEQSAAQGEQSGKINLNTATADELDKLPGIGSTRAQAIVDYRQSNGRFLTVDDLKNVPGFGVKLVDQVRGSVFVK